MRDRVAAAENAGFTFATFDDSILPPSGDVVGRIDAVSRASYVAATTSTIGLVPVVGTTYAEPFHTSSQLATLDYSSRGRGGWLAVPVEDDAAARAWGRAPVTTESARQQEQRDSVTVVTDLWDSWEDDAVVRDYLSGRFLERDRLHYVNFEGDTFSVKGPAIVPRPPQGQLVVFGRYGEIDPRQPDVVLVSGDSVETIAQSAAKARDEGASLVVAEVDVAFDTPNLSAAQRRTELNSYGNAVRHRPTAPGCRSGGSGRGSEGIGRTPRRCSFPFSRDRRGPSGAGQIRASGAVQGRVDATPGSGIDPEGQPRSAAARNRFAHSS